MYFLSWPRQARSVDFTEFTYTGYKLPRPVLFKSSDVPQMGCLKAGAIDAWEALGDVGPSLKDLWEA